MRKGFTLVELLAVIAIVAVLGIITVPMVMTTVEEANKSAFTSGAQNVFDTARTYITRIEETGTLPDEGISVNELKNELKNFNYISGVILKEKDGSIIVDGLSDGKYCASGTKNNLRVIKGNCSNLDNTPPTVKVLLNKRTSNSITILVNASDSTSGIYGYSYSRDGKNYSEIINNNIYTVDGLSKDETVKIYVRVYNNLYDKTNSEENLAVSMTEQLVEFTTLNIEKPKFVISTSENSAATIKLVDIIYPENNGNYEYTYEIDGKEEVVNSDRVRLNITSNIVIKARIKSGTEIIENELRIAGLDNDGPIANIVYNQTWEKSKKIKIEVISEQTGLPLEPYSYDGGKTWTNNNEKVYVSGENVTNKIQVRDILGNITTKLKINGEDKEEIIIDYIDNERPNCVLKITNGTIGLNGWYTSNVQIDFDEINDVAKYCNNGICEDKTPGSGIKNSNIDIKQVTSDGITNVIGTVIDNMNHSNTCDITIKRDATTPNITAKSSTTNLKFNENKKLIDLFTVSEYGKSGGTTTCYLIQNNQRGKVVNNNNELGLGINIIECEMVTGAGNKASSRVTIKHQYNASPYCTAGTYQNGTCRFESNASVCGTEQKQTQIQTWSDCAYTVNTCQYGCDSVWNPNINCTTQTDYNNCTQWKCSVCATCNKIPVSHSSTYTSGSECTKKCDNGRGFCRKESDKLFTCFWTTYKVGQSCQYCGTTTAYGSSCNNVSNKSCNAYGTKQVCSGGYEQTNCSNCKTGNASECRGDYITTTKTETVAASCNKSEYISYSCPTAGTNTNINQNINAFVAGNICQF